MENYQSRFTPLLPRLLFCMCLMIFTYTMLNLWTHVFTLFLLWFYEKFALQKDAYRTPYLSQITSMYPLFLFLFLFYAVFLQTGRISLFTLQISNWTWDVYAESVIYAVHYILLFVETFWVTYLLFHERKMETVQTFFYGNLFSLTLLWNGSIQQWKNILSCKTRFDQALVARGAHLKRFPYILTFFEYALENTLKQTYHQIPTLMRMWKNKDFYTSGWVQKIVWVVPVLFIGTSFLKNEILVDQYLEIQTMIVLIGIAMFYVIVNEQYEEMSPLRIWTWSDRVICFVWGSWLVVQIFKIDDVMGFRELKFFNLSLWSYFPWISVGLFLCTILFFYQRRP
ncbi:MAG: hypothetical protein KDD46_07110 [Bdellovibrionales bacterium]|nr:hypothetical protein [Bdellovibrionales bacterium]